MRRLTQRRVDALKPRKAAYEVRDAELKGSGVRLAKANQPRIADLCTSERHPHSRV